MTWTSGWALRGAALSVVLATTATGVARAAGPTTEPAAGAVDQKQLLDEVRELRAEVDALKAQGKPAPAVVAAPAVADPAVVQRAVANDAEMHSRPPLSFDSVNDFMSGFTLDRFTLQSTDGKFVLRPWLHLQFRDVVNDREHFKVGGGDDVDDGFEVRRLRFGADGNLFGPDLTYFFNWATVRANGTSTVTNAGKTVGTVSNNLGGVPLLEEAWFRYRLPGSDFYIKAGQIKDPVYHESIVSSRYQQATERSLTGDIFFNGDTFAEGTTFGYDPKTFIRAEAGIDHGIRSANTNFLDPTDGNSYDYGAVGRVEVKPFGRWQDYQMGAAGVTQPLLVAGLGSEYSEHGHVGQTVGAADVMYADPSGLSLFGAVADRYTTSNFGLYTQSPTGASIGTPGSLVAGKATNEYAFVGEVGYLFGQHLEPFGRYEYIHVAGDANGSRNYFSEITAGANYYFYGHRAKLTGQGVYLPTGIPIDDTPNDVLASPNARGEFVFIGQFQLLI
jgi:hypothetical protein